MLTVRIAFIWTMFLSLGLSPFAHAQSQSQSLGQRAMLNQMNHTLDYLKSRQLPDKSWSGAFVSDVTQDGMLAITGKKIGLLTEGEQQVFVAHVLARQDASGNGWVAYPGGPIDMNVTAFTLTVLQAFGVNPKDSKISRAWAFYLAHGGDDSLSTPFKLYLISLGLRDDSSIFLPTPHELVTAPNNVFLFRFGLIGDMFFPYIAMKILRKVPDGAWQNDRLTLSQYLTQPMHIGPHSKPESNEEALRPPLHDVKLVRQILSLTLHSRGLDQTWYGTCFSAFNLLLLNEAQRVGLGDFSDVIRTAWQSSKAWEVKSEDGSRVVEPMRSDVWDTAAVMTSLSYLPPELQSRLQEFHPETSVQWLLHHRNFAYGVVTSAWSFDSRDQARPDSDDTGAALFTLARFQKYDPQNIRAAIANGTTWILNLQNGDGGFAAWSRDVSHTVFWAMEKLIGFPKMADISQSDITSRLAHVFDTMNSMGLINPQVTATLNPRICQFFNEQALTVSNIPVRTFVGHWFSNYLYANSQLIIGLRGAHCANKEPWIRDLTLWIMKVQQREGGWGEDNSSYQTGKYVEAPATLAQTTLTIAGLIDAYEELRDRDPALASQIAVSIDRGLQFVDLKTASGTKFFEPQFTAILIKGLQYSRYELLPAYVGLYDIERWYQIRYPSAQPQGVAR